MSALTRSVAAQVGAEVRTRLRSPGTIVAFLALLAGSYLWIPDPRGKASSISWETSGGILQAPLYSAPYLGVAMALLAGFFLLVIAFFLIAGSVRRDRERGVGAILAATPMSKSAYLLGKLAAHVVYLSALTALVVPVGLYNYLRFGSGPLDLAPFLLPTLLVALPGIVFVAAMAVLFDVTPGLRGRAGPLVWFVTGLTLISAAPVGLARLTEGERPRIPVFDPSGAASLDVLIVRSLPDINPKSLSAGLIFHDRPIERVPWKGVPIDADFVATRALNLLWAVPPLFLAILLFDRFDPARGRRRGARRRAKESMEREGPDAIAAPSLGPPASLPALLSPAGSRRSQPRPTAWRAVVAETALAWQTASWLRWPLLVTVVLATVLPIEATRFAALGFLLLLAPVIAEVPARESLAGSGPLVFSQPGVPRSAVLWKLAALSLFVLALGLLPLLRATLDSPARGFAFLTGLLFTAALATVTGSMSGGGKLFLGLYLWLWYAAASRVPALDFCGVMGGALDLRSRAVYLGLGALAVGMAWIVERRRRR